uniref:Uncharacterized protein n=1 Tax=Timema poppense TaxID=170557 RepID=A0A7R9H7S2_TIMPO|nr:unnamed protein product [Timema poppensis]
MVGELTVEEVCFNKLLHPSLKVLKHYPSDIVTYLGELYFSGNGYDHRPPNDDVRERGSDRFCGSVLRPVRNIYCDKEASKEDLPVQVHDGAVCFSDKEASKADLPVQVHDGAVSFSDKEASKEDLPVQVHDGAVCFSDKEASKADLPVQVHDGAVSFSDKEASKEDLPVQVHDGAVGFIDKERLTVQVHDGVVCFSDKEASKKDITVQVHDSAPSGSMAEHCWRSDSHRDHDMAAGQVLPLQCSEQQGHVSLPLQVHEQQLAVRSNSCGSSRTQRLTNHGV